jgi:CDP-diacylglycerol pyrophosphatase
MAHAQRWAFTAVASLMALSPLASPVLAGDTSPTLRPPRAAASTVTCPVPAPPPPNPNALWNLVECCKQGKDTHCVKYNPDDVYIVAKDASKSKPEAYLIIPSIKMTGIEDSQTLKTPTLNIWQNGWEVSLKRLKFDESNLGLAINSRKSRDQDQLHIHMSCVKSGVFKALEGVKVSSDPTSPTKLQLPPNNNTYAAVLLERSLVGNSSPFKILRQLPHVNAQNISEQSVAIVKGRDPQTFVFLNTYAHDQDQGEAEELLNQTCSR